LITRDNGTDIILTINVKGLADGESANLSIKQPDFDCGGENVTIEVSSDQVQNGSYTYTLPAGAYELVAYTTAEMLGPIQISSDTEEDLTFTPSAP
jgi:hypothetical protein